MSYPEDVLERIFKIFNPGNMIRYVSMIYNWFKPNRFDRVIKGVADRMGRHQRSTSGAGNNEVRYHASFMKYISDEWSVTSSPFIQRTFYIRQRSIFPARFRMSDQGNLFHKLNTFRFSSSQSCLYASAACELGLKQRTGSLCSPIFSTTAE